MLFISTILRWAPDCQATCFLYTVDIPTWTVTSRATLAEPPWREFDPNPRGGMRGARGIAVGDGVVYVANSSTLFTFEPGWRLVYELSFPACASIHDLRWQDEKLWITSCRNDMLFAVGQDQKIVRQIDVRAESGLADALPTLARRRRRNGLTGPRNIDYRDPRTHSERLEDTAHLNSVVCLADGSILISLGLIWTLRSRLQLTLKDYLHRRGLWKHVITINRSLRALLGIRKHAHTEMVLPASKNTCAIVRVWPDGAFTVPLVLERMHMPGHSLKTLADGSVLYLDTSHHNVLRFNPDSGEILNSIRVPDEFLRGAVVLSDGRLLVGSQSSLYQIDLEANRSTKLMTLNPEEDDAIFAIVELPDEFGALPIRLGSPAVSECSSP